MHRSRTVIYTKYRLYLRQDCSMNSIMSSANWPRGDKATIAAILALGILTVSHRVVRAQSRQHLPGNDVLSSRGSQQHTSHNANPHEHLLTPLVVDVSRLELLLNLVVRVTRRLALRKIEKEKILQLSSTLGNVISDMKTLGVCFIILLMYCIVLQCSVV